jgi:hypothetical protein
MTAKHHHQQHELKHNSNIHQAKQESQAQQRAASYERKNYAYSTIDILHSRFTRKSRYAVTRRPD